MPDVDVDVKFSTKGLSAVLASVNGLNAAMSKQNRGLSSYGNNLSGAMKGHQGLNREVSISSRLMNKLNKSMRMLFWTAIAFVAEFVITAATLASVNLLLKTGQALSKAYGIALGGVAAAVVSLTAAISVGLAAFVEYTAAMTAFNYKGSAAIGDGMARSASAMRSFAKDTGLATLGIVGLTQAYKVMAIQGAVTSAQRRALAGALDFSATTADPSKSAQQIAAFIGILAKEKKYGAKSAAAAQQISPEFVKAIGSQKDKSAAGIMQNLASGSISTKAGLGGQNALMSQTLVGQFKAYTASLAIQFADFGEGLLEPVKDLLESYFKVLRNTFRRIQGVTQEFAKMKLLPGMTTLGEKLGNFVVTLTRKYLPLVEGASGYLAKTWTDLRKSFSEFVESLQKFKAGSTIITKTFGPAIIEFFKVFGRNAEKLAYLAEDNKDTFLTWGVALQNLIASLGDFFAGLKVAFTEALPVLTAIVNALSALLRGLGRVASAVGTFQAFGGQFAPDGGAGKSGTRFAGLGPFAGAAVAGGMFMAMSKGRRRRFRGAALNDPAAGASRYAAAVAGNQKSMSQTIFGSGRGRTRALGSFSSGIDDVASGVALSRWREINGRNQYGFRQFSEKEMQAGTAFSKVRGNFITPYDPNSPVNQSAMPLGLSGKAARQWHNRRITTQLRRANAENASIRQLRFRDLRSNKAYNKAVGSGRGQRFNDAFRNRGTTGLGGVGFNPPSTSAARFFATKTKINAAMRGRSKQMQAGLKQQMSPGLGMAGMMLMSSGALDKIQDRTTRNAATGAAMGSIMGGKGMLIGGGLGMMAGQTSYAKGMLGGGAAGYATAASFTSGMPEQVKAVARIAGFLIGTAAGAIMVKSNRTKLSKAAASSINTGIMSDVVTAMLRDKDLSTTGARDVLKRKSGQRDSAIRLGGKAGIQQLYDQGFFGSTSTAEGKTAAQAAMANANLDRTSFYKTAGVGSSVDTQNKLALDNFDERIKLLMQRFGVDRRGAAAMAKKSGIDLFNTSLTVGNMFERLGKKMRMTAEDLKFALLDIGVGAMAELDKFRKRRGVTEAVRKQTMNLKELGGNATVDDFIDFQQTQFDYNSLINADDPAKQLQMFADMASGAMFKPGGLFDGNKELERQFNTKYDIGGGVLASGADMSAAAGKKGLSGAAGVGAQGVAGLLADRGFELDNQEMSRVTTQLQNAITGDPQKLGVLQDFLANKDVSAMDGNQILEEMAKVGLIGDLTGLNAERSFQALVAENLTKLGAEWGQQFLDALTVGFDDKPEWWENAPPWWQKGLKVDQNGNPTPDTYSPRRGLVGDTRIPRALGATLGAHSRFDSMLTGSRSITSSFRTDMLGSPSSDHLAGRAYDLVGQNLGQYSKMINDSGGFAEFHGVGGTRHLHVVPPLGDTGTSRSVSGVKGSKAGNNVVTPVTVNVYGGPGQSAELLAQKVMDVIARAQQNAVERS